MTGLVQAFWLQRVDCKKRTYSVSDTREELVCPLTGSEHELEVYIPDHVSFHNEVSRDDGFYLVYDQTDLKLKCKCGHAFSKQHSDSTISTSQYTYTNPKTGKSDDSPSNVATPGAMWECPWYVDRRDPDDLRAGFSGILSRFYVEQWYQKRNPIAIMCPDRSWWVIDQKSSNGEGWTITGDWQSDPVTLTAHPSIVVPGYHGWLQNGWFTEDCEGRVFDREKMNEARS